MKSRISSGRVSTSDMSVHSVESKFGSLLNDSEEHDTNANSITKSIKTDVLIKWMDAFILQGMKKILLLTRKFAAVILAIFDTFRFY